MKPNDFGKKLLVEQCQKIRLADFVGKAREQIKESILQASIEAEGYNILLNSSITGFGGTMAGTRYTRHSLQRIIKVYEYQ